MKHNSLSLIVFVLCCLVLGGGETYAQGWTDDGANVRLTTSTDKVGIGTTVPSTKLDVNGDFRVSGYNTLGNGIANSHFPYSSNGWSYISGKGIIFREDAVGGYIERMRIADNGFVGIGTSTPTTILDVVGTVTATRLVPRNTGGSLFIGENAGLNDDPTSNSNSFVGNNAGYSNTTGYLNSFFGVQAGYLNTTGYLNSFFGGAAGFSNTTAFENSFFGHAAGYSNTIGIQNSFFGKSAGYSCINTYYNSFFGAFAGYNNNTGYDNSFFGKDAGFGNTTGVSNSFFGTWAGDDNTSGQQNSFFGVQAGGENTTGNFNSFFGKNAGLFNTTGMLRTAVGLSANSLGAAYNNNTGLGYGADCTASDQVRIGNSAVTSIGGYANWTNISDSRFKKNVQEDVKGLEFITALRPVSYNLDIHGVEDFFSDRYGERPSETLPGHYDKESIRYSGFIAQEVESAAKAVGYDFSGVDAPKNEADFYGLRYAEFVVPLVKAVQEQQETINLQQESINLLVAALEKKGIEVGKLKDKGKATPKEQGKDLGSEVIQTPANTSDLGALPTDYELSQSYPNPSNPSATIAYALPHDGTVTLEIYNSLGQKVRTLVNEFQGAGYKSVVWNGRNDAGESVASGSYVYRLVAANHVKTQKMILAK